MKAYTGCFEKFRKFCKKENLLPFPAATHTVAAFLQSRLDEGVRASRVAHVVAGISWEHQVEGLEDPTKSPIIGNLLIAAKPWQPPITHKEPARVAHLLALAEGSQREGGLKSLRLAALATLLMAGCLRLDDVLKLKKRHFQC